MKRRSIPFIALAAFSLCFASAISASAQSFSGQATAVKATVTVPLAPVLTTAVNDTGPLPSSGGSINLASAGATVPSLLSVGASTVSTSGSGLTSQSNASVAGLNTALAGFGAALTVTADVVSSSTQCVCAAGTCTGSSVITNLRIGGNLIAVTGAANQFVVVTVGTVTLTILINEQIISPGSRTVNALNITLTDSLTGVATNVIVASSHSDITCAFAGSIDRYSGRATGVRLRVNTIIIPSSTSTIVSDTGFLPASGGNIFAATAGVSVPGVLTTGVVSSRTSGGLPGGNVDTSQSSSTVAGVNVSVIGAVTLTATIVESNTQCQCSISNTASCTGGSRVVDLVVTVAGIPIAITVTGAPNQVVPIPGLGQIILNEQIPVSPTATGEITVNAIHVLLTVPFVASTDLIIAHSHSDIQCTLVPSASNVGVSGRVLDINGRGIAGVSVTATDASGISVRRVTSTFGFYFFEELNGGSSYIFAASHKRHSFASRVVMLEDEVTGLDFTPEPTGGN